MNSAKKLQRQSAALDKSGREAHEALRQCEDELFSETDRVARRTEDQAVSRAHRSAGS